MAPSRNGRRKEGSMRIDAALAAMRPMGFPDRVVRKSVKDLLKIYGVGDNGWYFIEEASYKLLIETILENEGQPQPEKTASEVEKQGDQRVHNVDGNGEHQLGSLPLLCDHQDSNHGPQEASLAGKHCCAEQPHEGQEEADAAIANDADESCRRPIRHQSTSTPTLQLPTTPVGIRPVTPLLLSPSPRVISSAPPPPPLPTTAGWARPSKRRQPCYGWIDSDEDDTDDDFIELTPAAEWDDSNPGQAHRRSRWDLRPDDP